MMNMSSPKTLMNRLIAKRTVCTFKGRIHTCRRKKTQYIYI